MFAVVVVFGGGGGGHNYNMITMQELAGDLFALLSTCLSICGSIFYVVSSIYQFLIRQIKYGIMTLSASFLSYFNAIPAAFVI